MLDLTRLIAEAAVLAGGDHPCAILGHKWIFTGGSPCDCPEGGCSRSVHVCEACGDCDYGDNQESRDTIAACKEREAADAD